MRIAILADSLDNQSAGVHTYTKQLIQALMKHSGQNEYLLVREKVDQNLPIKQVAIPTIHWPIGFASLRKFFIIPFILRKYKVDVVFEPAHFGPFNLPARIKRITMIHDLTPLLFPEYHRFHSQLLQRIFLKHILRKADLIFSNSQNTTKDIVKIFPFAKTKTKTILLGRDESFQSVTSQDYLKKNDWIEPYFLITGTIEPRKNFETLLDAYRLFRDKAKEKVLLLIVGQKGWKTKRIFEQIEAHPYRNEIKVTGFIKKNQLIEVYSNALALIYPSLYEGFGLPVLEAMACGTRVICSDNSSLPEVGGEVGLYFDPNKIEELLAHLLSVYKKRILTPTDKDLLIQQAQKFSWKKHAIAFVNALENLDVQSKRKRRL